MTKNATAPQAEEAGQLSQDEMLASIAEATERRAEIYGIVSRIYRVEVNEEFLAELKETSFPAKTGNDKMDRGYRLISKYLSRPTEGMLLELAVDYARTYIGTGTDGYSASYPYESVYTSEQRLVMQEARDEVLAVYRASGLNKSEQWKDEEDHVALELQFEQILCERAAEALRKGDEDAAYQLFRTQRGFLKHHLLNWVPMMTADTRKFAKTDFYQGLSYLTEGFLAMDAEFLDELLSEDEGPDDATLPKIVPAVELLDTAKPLPKRSKRSTKAKQGAPADGTSDAAGAPAQGEPAPDTPACGTAEVE